MSCGLIGYACVYIYLFFFIIALKLVTATQPAEMSSVKLVTRIPCFRDVTFPISEILSGHPACSLWCPPWLLDFFKKLFNVNLLPLVDLQMNIVLQSPFNLVLGFCFQRNSFSAKHVLSVL